MHKPIARISVPPALGKKEYEEFLDRIQNHVIINWGFGSDIGTVIKTMDDPEIEEPQDLTDEQEKVKWRVRLWNQSVDRYGEQQRKS